MHYERMAANLGYRVKTGLRSFIEMIPPTGQFDEDSAANEIIATTVGRSNVQYSYKIQDVSKQREESDRLPDAGMDRAPHILFQIFTRRGVGP